MADHVHLGQLGKRQIPPQQGIRQLGARHVRVGEGHSLASGGGQFIDGWFDFAHHG